MALLALAVSHWRKAWAEGKKLGEVNLAFGPCAHCTRWLPKLEPRAETAKASRGSHNWLGIPHLCACEALRDHCEDRWTILDALKPQFGHGLISGIRAYAGCTRRK